MRLNTYTLPVAIFAVITLAGVAFGVFGNYSWANWVRAGCYESGCFCEAARGGPIEQISNTYSNLGFVLIGLLIVFTAKRDEKNLMGSSLTYPISYGVTVIAIGAGSFFYHGSLTEIGRWFDWFGMYLYASFIILYNLSRLRRLSGVQFIIAYIIANLILAYIIFSTAPAIRQQIFGLLIAITLVLETIIRFKVKPQVTSKFLYGALGCLVAAFAIWILDSTRVLCAPTSLLQGHAAWHILDAIAAGLMFIYYRSELKNAAPLPNN